MVSSIMRNPIFVSLLTLAVVSPAYSHGGRTDSEGYHYDSSKDKSPCHKKSKKRESSSDSVDYSYDRSSWRHWFDVDRDCPKIRERKS